MTRDNLLFAIIGVLFGFIVGFLFASTMNQRYGPGAPQAASSSQMPADHPPLGANPSAPASGNMQAQVSAKIEKARSEPKNFDAQVEAGELFYQVQRFDQAIEFLLKANQIKPDDYRTIVFLGVANLDAGHYDVAEKWYKAALLQKSDDVVTLSGMAAAQLAKGDAKAAEQAIANLEKVDPTSEDLPQFKEKLATLKK
ncbi:MAG TPA: tetratricopeptide repeat protein [Pyrinomonadaceae bacterium]|jgi:tetratricopeptide (TPR) repeat protein|nr:tetratricopeptide repeat protein [Pyrinomonadaceae bacterium]